MGEIAEMMLEGDLCGCCGAWLEGSGDGFPRYCSKQCAQGRGVEHDDMVYTECGQPRLIKTRCPECNKLVKKVGLAQHTKDKHRSAA